MGHMVPLLRKITLHYENTCDNTLKEIQFRPQDCVTYWRGVMLMVDSVADNWWCMLLLHFIFVCTTHRHRKINKDGGVNIL